jgi:monoterpene epsilon-lactone hydrolase
MPSAEIQKVRDILAGLDFGAPADVATMRARLDAAAALFQRPSDVRYEPIDAGGVPAEWTIAPDADAERALVYFHGGSYNAGGIGSHRALCTQLARASRLRVLSVEYRLAPEHPHPAAVEDACAALRFVWKSGFAPSQVGLAGDSAGGGLALAALVALRDAGDPLPAAAALLSPWTDLTLSGASFLGKADVDPMIVPGVLAIARDRYVAGQAADAPTISPLFADLAGLPPLLVQVGTDECLLDDSTRLADRASDAGTDVVLEVWDDMIHVWQAFFSMLPEGREAIDAIAAFLRARLK